MLNFIICLIKGHKRYSPQALKGVALMEIKDALAQSLVKVHVCQRCKAVYAEFQ